MAGEHSERLRLRFAPDDLFDLVSDVRSYPKFIELISAMRVTQDKTVEGTGDLTAEARVRFKFVREKFTTDVHLDRTVRRIDVSYISGPFHELANRWRFFELEDGSTLVDFWIRYSFKNPVLQVLFDSNRSRAIRYLVASFEREAERRYSHVGEPSLDVEAAIQKLASEGAFIP